MTVREEDGRLLLVKEKQVIGFCRLCAEDAGWRIEEFFIDPAWRRRGYGSYLLRQALARSGGFAVGEGSLHSVRPPADAAEGEFWARFGFVPRGGLLVRRRPPELSAVRFVRQFLVGRLPAGGFAVDATCGNGHDTEFLCRAVGPAGRVLALDIQPQAVANTRARLEKAGLTNAEVLLADHAGLAQLAPPQSADCVMFNFGWLPGGDHTLHSDAQTSLQALRAALELLREGGVLSAILYSGAVIGTGEKDAVRDFLRKLPLEKYTALECRFANWADTAPLPWLVIRK